MLPALIRSITFTASVGVSVGVSVFVTEVGSGTHSGPLGAVKCPMITPKPMPTAARQAVATQKTGLGHLDCLVYRSSISIFRLEILGLTEPKYFGFQNTTLQSIKLILYVPACDFMSANLIFLNG